MWTIDTGVAGGWIWDVYACCRKKIREGKESTKVNPCKEAARKAEEKEQPLRI